MAKMNRKALIKMEKAITAAYKIRNNNVAVAEAEKKKSIKNAREVYRKEVKENDKIS